MSGSASPLRAKYPDRVLCALWFDFNGANEPTIVMADGFDSSVHTHVGGTGVYGFALSDKHAGARGWCQLQINAGAAQYFTKVEVDATTKAVTLSTLTEAGVATQVAAGKGSIYVYAAENPLPPT